jgi:hypothetical protein
MPRFLARITNQSWLDVALAAAEPHGLTDEVRAAYDAARAEGASEARSAWAALYPRDLIPKAPSGMLGWPLAPSLTFPGERTLACPTCLGTNVTMGASYAATGTGLGGCGRMGDPGSREWVRCDDCGRTSSKEAP